MTKQVVFPLYFFFLQIVSSVRAGFRSRHTLPKEYRVKQLRALWRMIEESKERFFEAVWKDLRKLRWAASTCGTRGHIESTDVSHCSQPIHSCTQPVRVSPVCCRIACQIHALVGLGMIGECKHPIQAPSLVQTPHCVLGLSSI